MPLTDINEQNESGPRAFSDENQAQTTMPDHSSLVQSRNCQTGDEVGPSNDLSDQHMMTAKTFFKLKNGDANTQGSMVG
jgi:hypothetical protein